MSGMNRHVADNAFWGDAYANLSKQVNLNWAYDQANLGPSLYEDFGYEAVFVVNSVGETTYSVIHETLAQVDAHQRLGNGLDVLFVQARAAIDDESTAAGLPSAVGYRGQAADEPGRHG